MKSARVFFPSVGLNWQTTPKGLLNNSRRGFPAGLSGMIAALTGSQE